jgi:hypothetical protein
MEHFHDAFMCVDVEMKLFQRVVNEVAKKFSRNEAFDIDRWTQALPPYIEGLTSQPPKKT